MPLIQALLFLLFLLVPSLSGSEIQTVPTRFPAADRIVAIGDLHGDLDATRKALRLAGAIDGRDRWIGGKLVVVQTGDQLDRGDGEQEILDLLSRLSDEAKAAGGALHVLNGNHEIMNARLDLRYVTPGGFADFEDAVEVPKNDPRLEEYARDQRARVVAFRPGGRYARILARHNIVVIVGDNVFVHGGVLPHHVEYGLERMNREAREWLAGEGKEPKWVRDSDSPIWARTYSKKVDGEDCDTLGETLKLLRAKRMIVGHTVQKKGIRSRCDERVWCIDAGLAAHYGGEMSVLEIRGDRVRVLKEK